MAPSLFKKGSRDRSVRMVHLPMHSLRRDTLIAYSSSCRNEMVREDAGVIEECDEYEFSTLILYVNIVKICFIKSFLVCTN